MIKTSPIYPFGAAFEPAGEAQWRALVDQALKGAPFDRLVARTADGIPLQPLTGRRANGPRPVRSVTGGWTALTRIDHPDGAAANEQARIDLEGGAAGLHLIVSGAAGAYGFGLPAEALDQLLEGLDPARCEFLIDAGTHGPQAAAAIASHVENSGLNPASARITFGLDPIAALLHAEPASEFSALAANAVETTRQLRERGFAGPFVVADARPVHAAGGSEAQELGFLLAAATAYLRAFEQGGIAPADARGCIEFRIAADADQFLTIAKLRALRRLMARVEDACGLEAAPIRIHAETAWRMMTRHDPWVNALRATAAVFSAVTGGADSICVLPHTQALGLPEASARRLARNIQLVLNEESHLGQVDDAAGGAAGIEKLTDDLCIKAWTLFQDFERQGGIAAAMPSGSFTKDVAAVRDKRSSEVARGKLLLTGTSSFPNLEEEAATVLVPFPDDWRDQYAPAWRPSRLAEGFERLRDASKKAAAAGAAPQVFLVNFGTVAEHMARATFARNFLAAGGLSAIGGDSLSNANQVAKAFMASGARLACLCSSDELYREHGAACAQALKAAGASAVLIALRPGDAEDAWRAAGVDFFLYQGCNMIETLEAILTIA